jgi:hypothetical protein
MRKIGYSPQSRGARNRSAFSKLQSRGFNPGTNFLLTCSDQTLAAYETKCLATVANLRGDLQEIFVQLGEAIGQALLVRWFRNTDRDELRMSLDTPADTVAWAKEQIRRQGRSDEQAEEELSEILSLNPGLAHRTAAQTYQRRNIAEGKCIPCPKPLDRNSTTYCTEHLRYQRLRHKPIGSAAPGSADFLYADAEQLQSRHGRQAGTLANLTMQREQKT